VAASAVMSQIVISLARVQGANAQPMEVAGAAMSWAVRSEVPVQAANALPTEVAGAVVSSTAIN